MVEFWIQAFFYVMLENLFDKSQKVWIRCLFLILFSFTMIGLLFVFILLIYGCDLAYKEKQIGISLLLLSLVFGVTYGFYTIYNYIRTINSRNIKYTGEKRHD